MPTFKNGSKAFSGSIISIDNKTGSVSNGRTNANDTQRFDSFTINGTTVLLMARLSEREKEITLRPFNKDDFPDGGFNAENPGFVGSKGGEWRDPSDKFAELRYGVYNDTNNVSHLFVHGNPSSFVPKEDKVYTYRGSAVMGKEGKYDALRKALTAEVNFASKKVAITLNLPTNDNRESSLKFGGTISGNTFAGTENGVETRGGFFNHAARDMGGTFQVIDGEKKGYNGAYGATMQ